MQDLALVMAAAEEIESKLDLSDQFDLIIGDDWISYCHHSLRCNDLDGRRHNLIIQSDQHQVHCPVISAVKHRNGRR